MELGSTMEALKEHLDAVGLLTNLRSETRKDPAAVAKIVDRLATAQVHTADALQRQGRFQEAGTHADEGVALFASLTVRENPDSDWRRGLIEAKMAAASARIELGQQDDGDRLISEADAEVDELIRDDPLDLRIHRLSGEVKTWVANEIKYTSNDDLTAAIDMYRDAAAKLSRLSILAPDDVRTRREALEAIQGLANLFEAAGRHKEAYDLCDTVNQKFQAFVVGGSTRWKIDLAESDLACARMLVQLNRLAEARHLVHHGKRIAEEIRRQHPSSEDIDWRLTLAEALLHPAGSADEGERKRERQQGVAILSGLEARNALPRRWKPTLDALRRELRVQDEPRP
jgi:tetratricopeptide (TPR) repeat protein